MCCAMATLTVCSCSSSDDDESVNEKVALILPDGATVSRWTLDAQYLTKSLKSYGYDVQLFTASENNEGAAKQVKQIEEAVKAGYQTIVITPVDYEKINESGILEANQDCNFICYDRMIMNNPAVDFYASCDPGKIGEMQAQFLLEKADGDMTIEYFAGPVTDKNSKKYFDSAYRLLSANKSLSVPSGKVAYEDVALASWSSDDAFAEMSARLEGTNVMPDLILAPNDNVAEGVIKALEARWLGINEFPVITGQDLTEAAIANILARKQTMSIYKEYEDLAETTAMIVSCFISGKPVVTGKTFNNGAKEVPAKYSNFTLVTIDNIGNYITNSLSGR